MKNFIKRIAVLFFVAVLWGTVQSAPVFPVKYSANSRYLVDQNNVPFPILGRTAWFVTSLSSTDYRTFVDDTAARGYTAIELHVINHDPRGNRPPYGGNNDLPFLKRLDGGNWSGALTYGNINNEAPNLTTPNEPYWAMVDGLLAYAESKGLLVFIFPAYVGYAGGAQGWMQELVANGSTKAQTYGAWLANRYKNQKNLVWMMGGDMGTAPNAFNSAQTSAESGLLAGLKSVSGQSIYYSAEWESQSIATDQATFGSAMTLNGAYSWTGDVANQGRRAYAYSSTRPAYLLEEPYDEEGSDGNSANPSATQPVRRFQWWGWLSTIGGYISGNGYVWPFKSGWQSHLNTQGSRDMGRLNAFVSSIAWYNLVPSGLNGMRTLVTAGGSSVSAADYVTAAAAPDGTLLVAYIPPAHSGSITVDMGAMSGLVRARWFDPTSAAYTDIGTGYANSGTRAFTPTGNNSVGQKDWVLVLDRAVGSAAPTISNIADQSTLTNMPTAAIPFTIADADTAVTSLTLSKASSNPTLVPVNNIVFGGSGANRTVTVTPANNQTGNSTITVSVSDGTNTTSDSFTITVNTAAGLGTVRVNSGGGAFTDSAGRTWSADTGYNTGTANTVTAAINNTTDDVLYQTERYDTTTSPELEYAFTVPSGNYQVNLHFAETYSGAFSVGARVFDVLVEGQLRVDNLDIYSQVGANTPLVISLPVTVSDGQLNISFVHGVQNPKICAIEVVPAAVASTPPTISDIPNQTTAMNAPTAAIPFTVNDAQTPANSLTLSKSSSNPTLVPTANIAFGGSGSSRTVTVTPASGQTGTATITVSVSDGTNSASDTFTVTVSGTQVASKAFTNSAAITIPDQGAATPYASVINVSGVASLVSSATVTLRSLTHTWSSDVDVVLVSPGGQKVLLMSDVGNGGVNNVTLTLSDSAASALPTSALTSGTFRPANYTDNSGGGDNFPSPAPTAPYGGTLSAFNGQAANGTWSLYVFDDGVGDAGSIAGGWSLTLTTTNASPSPTAPPSAALITSVSLDSPDMVQVTADAAAGASYILQASSDMKNWVQVDVENNISGSMLFTEPKTTNAVRFYRILSVP